MACLLLVQPLSLVQVHTLYSILGKNIDSFLAATASQSNAYTHFPMQWYWMLGVKLQKREDGRLYLPGA